MMTRTKWHVPSTRHAVGLRGSAMCGRWVTYESRDHDFLRRLASGPAPDAHWCRQCIRALHGGEQ